uniref:Small ribosomal subunit protein uS3m n=1 Tax=Haplomitrium mnioides TaxID=56921 RepID=A0A6C0SIG0_9MARC|nr:ribosomal protein S3 [Haplomitrium mnioides]QIA60185.1 ribosomal protein S3 [Haplomitrium mnioides]
MAQKVNPISVRLNLNRSSDPSRFSDYYYGKSLYRDFNFRDYSGPIRPPTGNTFGFRLGRCIIHHFPKRTFIHVFSLDRLSQSRHQGLGAIQSVKLIGCIHDDTVKQGNEVGIWLKKRHEYHDRSPSIRKIDQLLRVSDWMTDIHSTSRSIWPRDGNGDRRASEERYAFSRSAPSIPVAVRAEKKKDIFGSGGNFFGFTGRAFLDYFVMQYFPNLKNQIRFDPTVNRSPMAQGVAQTSTVGEAVPAKAGRGTQSGESICRPRSTFYFDAITFLGYARFRKATSLSSRYYYSTKMQSLFPNRTRTNTPIQPVKIAPVYQSASPIAQEISRKPEQKKSFRQICRSIFKQIKKCPYVRGIRIGRSGRLNGAGIARIECKKYGETSLHVSPDQIDYAKTRASTPYGISGVKVWVPYFLTKKKGTSRAISKTYKIS